MAWRTCLRENDDTDIAEIEKRGDRNEETTE